MKFVLMMNIVLTVCNYMQYAIVADKTQGENKKLKRNYKQLLGLPLLSRLPIKVKVRQTPSPGKKDDDRP